MALPSIRFKPRDSEDGEKYEIQVFNLMLKREQDTNSRITKTNHYFFQIMGKKTLRRQRMDSLERICFFLFFKYRFNTQQKEPICYGEAGLFPVPSFKCNIWESRLHDKEWHPPLQKCTAVITWESIYFSKLNISLSIDFPGSSQHSRVLDSRGKL